MAGVDGVSGVGDLDDFRPNGVSVDLPRDGFCLLPKKLLSCIMPCFSLSTFNPCIAHARYDGLKYVWVVRYPGTIERHKKKGR